MKKYIRIFTEKNSRDIIFLIIIIIVGTTLRLYNLDWDGGHYLHPDERLYVNASGISWPKNIKDIFSESSSLNPQMFYYGTFPLYLYKIVSTYLLPSLNFTITSRLVSALFSAVTIPLIYLAARNFLPKKESIAAAFIFAFAVESIQYAHFNTTESILTFLVSAILLFSIKFLHHQKTKYLVILGALMGLSYGTKITGVIFFVMPLLSLVLSFLNHRNYKKILSATAILAIVSIPIALIFSVYQIVDYQQFSREQTYMQSVILGYQKPPFTIIYENTPKYIFPLINVLPFNFGFIALPLAIYGFILLSYRFVRNVREQKFESFLIIFPLLFFLWSGGWFVKFSRYYILLFPFLAIWGAYALSKFSRQVQFLILILIGINGVLFLRIYLAPNTRIQASDWIYKNIPAGSIITGEHWDDNLPLPITSYSNITYTMKQATVYDPESTVKFQALAGVLSDSDYFIISSRRVSQSIIINKKLYPITSHFYTLLDNGMLGYEKIKTFTNYPFLISDDFADESFQSYDHPPVYIYKNVGRKPLNQILEAINYDK